VRKPSIVLLSLLCGCVGTRTGNPGNVDVPVGVELARSELARITDASLSDSERERFGQDNRAFAFALYNVLADKPGNLFLSPYSISTALAMQYAGARAGTASEMERALHFGLGQSKLHTAFNATDSALGKRKTELAVGVKTGNGFELRLVNQAWARKGYAFVDSYLDTLAQSYGAGLFLLDFSPPDSARSLINAWVEDQTEDLIKDLLPENSVTADTVLVLTNAIYFKASWLHPFDKSKTAPAVFHAADGDTDVATMQAYLRTSYAEVAGAQMVQIPYLSTNVSMLLVLPPAGDEPFAAEHFDALQAELADHLVTLSLPKWSFESEHSLKEPLSALGMPSAFAPGSADFTGMRSEPGLFIQAVHHKAFVAVDEDGTEAAAATAVVSGDVSAPPSVTVRFDRPFIFAVYDAPTGQVLFLGRVAQP
jgi:serpin B